MQQEIRGALPFMVQIYRRVLPRVHAELNKWEQQATRISDEELRKQALNSIKYKTFHCEGGSAYSVLAAEAMERLIPLIVAFQTISDYLDNLCDRSTSMEERDFHQLHLALQDAVHPEGPFHDYYLFHDEKEDGGYLRLLVWTCQQQIAQLPGYLTVYPAVRELVDRYCGMQVYKHLHPQRRRIALQEWFSRYHEKEAAVQEEGLYWNEFAAACGSTLGVFAMFASAARVDVTAEEVQRLFEAYFPWVCGLHILLDYFIDQEEDKLGGDLNFIAAYGDERLAQERLSLFVKQALARVKGLPRQKFHRLIIEGLLGLYLANRKVREVPRLKQTARRMLRQGKWQARFFYLNGRIILGRMEQTQPGR